MEEEKIGSKNRLTPETVILLTVGATAIGIILFHFIKFLITNF